MKQLKFALAACAASVVSFFSGCAPETEVVLVEKGEAKAYVVIDAGASASVTNAATALVHWVKEKTGTELSVLRAPSPAATTGAAEAAALRDLTPIVFRKLIATDPTAGFKYDGFKVEASSDKITISAIEDQGFEFAVHYLLNRYAGIDWFHPESGADFETSDTLAVPAGTLAKTPPRWRECLPAGNPKPDNGTTSQQRKRLVYDWNTRNGFSSKDNYMGGSFGEALLWTPVDKAEYEREAANIKTNWAGIFKAQPDAGSVDAYARWKVLSIHHPDWFALVDGKRVACGNALIGNGAYSYLHKSAMPCLSNPEVREQLLKNYLMRRRSLWYAAMDKVVIALDGEDHPCWCECDTCMKLVKFKGSLSSDDKASDYCWDFVNWLAPRILKADPTITLNAYAYQSHRAFPKKVKPVPHGDRLNVVLCTHGRCYQHELTNGVACAGNADMVGRILEWTKAGFPVVTFEYHGQTPGRCNYFFWERAWINDLKWYRANGIMHGSGYLIGPWHGWFGRDELYFDQNSAKAKWFTAYLTGHFYWDPDDDFDTVRDRMLTKYYRSAGREMLAYHKYLEKKFYDANLHMDYVDTERGFHDRFAQVVAGRPGVLKPAQDLLAAAKKAAADDPKALQRIAWDEKYFHEEWELAAPLYDPNWKTEAYARQGAIAIDGAIDEKDWLDAKVLDDFEEFHASKSPTKARAKTEARVTYDTDTLYFAVTCFESEMAKLVCGKPGEVDRASGYGALGDHVEIFYQAQSMCEKAFHLCINAEGAIVDAIQNSATDRDTTFRTKAKWATKKYPDRWTLEIAIPASEIGSKLMTGMDWRINVGRCRSVKGERAENTSLCNGNFYSPSGFLPLKLKAERATTDTGALVPFLAITGKPTEAEVVRKVDALHRDGFSSVLVYPRYGLELDYMGEDWLCVTETFCREAKRRGMKVWLYDEFGFPSGSCNCRLTTEPGAPLTRRLTEQGVFRNADGTFRRETRYADKEVGNVFDREAMTRFVELTHEVYGRRLKPYFDDGTIVAIFTDEPGTPIGPNWPKEPLVRYTIWEGLDADYRMATGGRDFNADVEAFLRDETNADVWKTYCEIKGRRFHDVFYGTINEWCRRMGIRSTGHLTEELCMTGGPLVQGDLLHALKGEMLPGMDEIFTNTEKGDIEWITFAVAQHAILRGAGDGLVELFAIGPNDMSAARMRQMIWLEALHGVNKYLVSMQVMDHRGMFTKSRYMSPVQEGQPWHKDLRVLSGEAERAARYAANTNFFCEIAVRYPQSDAAVQVYRGCRGVFNWNTFKGPELRPLLAEFRARQTDFELIEENEKTARRFVFRVEKDCYVEERSGERFATARAAADRMLELVKTPVRAYERDGSVADELVTRCYADGRAVLLNIRPNAVRELVIAKGGVRTPVTIPARGVLTLEPGELPRPEEVRASAPVDVSSWNVSFAGDNLHRFVLDDKAAARFTVKGGTGLRLVLRTVPEASYLLDGKPVAATEACRSLPVEYRLLYREVSLKGLSDGDHVLTHVGGGVESNFFLPQAFIAGCFAEQGSSLTVPSAQIVAADAKSTPLEKLGLGSYVGDVTFSARVRAPAGGNVRLALPSQYAFVRVRWSGKDLGVRAWAPYEWQLPDDASEGNLEITVSTSVVNMLGDTKAGKYEFWRNARDYACSAPLAPVWSFK